jgi:pimeloyl-ACP methyl ester carboxylesterase
VAPGFGHATQAERRWTEEIDAPAGWNMRNRDFWRQDGGYRRWIEFFFDQQLPEPHSTKQYEDAVGWALDTDAESMIAEREGRDAPADVDAESLCARLECPTLVIHGTEDRCQPLARGRRLAELTGGELVELHGSEFYLYLAAALVVIRRLIKPSPQPLPLANQAHQAHHPPASLTIICRSLLIRTAVARWALDQRSSSARWEAA